MGFRFRKSINLGGGFKMNLSKSGIGYSFGTKGYRVTKKANGGVRRTASIPGTGISYVKETGGKRSNNGCLNILFLWPIKLVYWMIYGMIWLCFIFPIKLIILLCKASKQHKENTNNENI